MTPLLSFPGAFDRRALADAGKDFISKTVRAVAPTPPVPLVTMVAEGDPAECLITASQDADLLVLGTRGRSPFMGMVLGSVSQRCAAAAQCPVVFVKLPAGQGE